MFRKFGTAAAALAVLTMAGCGTSDGDNRAAEPTKTAAATQTPEPAPTTEAPDFKPRKDSCKVKGSDATATLEDNEAAVVLTFDGETIAPTDTTGFYASIFDKAHETGGQIGAQYLDGELISYFTTVDPDGGQTEMTGKPERRGKRIIMTFPKSKGGLGDFRIAKWSAAYTLAGDDVGMCPDDYGTQPFSR